jgi:hypothetical protein
MLRDVHEQLLVSRCHFPTQEKTVPQGTLVMMVPVSVECRDRQQISERTAIFCHSYHLGSDIPYPVLAVDQIACYPQTDTCCGTDGAEQSCGCLISCKRSHAFRTKLLRS